MKRILCFFFMFFSVQFAQISTGISIKPFIIMPDDFSPWGVALDINYNIDPINCVSISPGYSADMKFSSYAGFDISFLFKHSFIDVAYGLTGIKLHFNKALEHGVSFTRLDRTIPMLSLGGGIKLNTSLCIEGNILVPIKNRVVGYWSQGYDFTLKKMITTEKEINTLLELRVVLVF